MSIGFLHYFLFFAVVAVFAHAETCDWPPAFWCDDELIARRCNVFESCANFNRSSLGRRLKLTLLYETLCKDCQRFIIDEFYPKVYAFAADFVEFEFVPYGNARRTRFENGTTKIDCQHGSEECLANKFHGCVINVTRNNAAKWMPFVNCMEMAARARADPEKAKFACYERSKIDQSTQDDIESCRNERLGDEIQNRAADITEGVWPYKHTSVPWILINGLSTLNMQIYQNNLLPALCAWYSGPSKPSGCEFAESIKRLKTCSKSDQIP